MPLLPLRFVMRNRWTTLVWAGGICVMAASFATRDETPSVDAANVADGNAAQASALLAEDDE